MKSFKLHFIVMTIIFPFNKDGECLLKNDKKKICAMNVQVQDSRRNMLLYGAVSL